MICLSSGGIWILGTTALKLDIETEFSLLGPVLAGLYGPLRATVGRLVGQYSDSNRVSQSLQTLSRESKKLKLYESREGRERIYFAISRRGEDWLSICESLWKIDSVFGSKGRDKTLRRGGGELTHL